MSFGSEPVGHGPLAPGRCEQSSERNFGWPSSKRINLYSVTDGLVKEEERLYGRSELTDDDRRRLSELKVELDQYGDLLRSAGHCANSGMT